MTFDRIRLCSMRISKLLGVLISMIL